MITELKDDKMRTETALVTYNLLLLGPTERTRERVVVSVFILSSLSLNSRPLYFVYKKTTSPTPQYLVHTRNKENEQQPVTYTSFQL